MIKLKNIKNILFDCDGVLYQDLEAVFGQVSYCIKNWRWAEHKNYIKIFFKNLKKTNYKRAKKKSNVI